MFRQRIIEREQEHIKSSQVQNGADYEYEKFEDFVLRVSREINNMKNAILIDSKIVNLQVSYPSMHICIVSWEQYPVVVDKAKKDNFKGKVAKLLTMEGNLESYKELMDEIKEELGV